MATRKKTKAAPKVEELDEIEELEDLELEDEPAPTPKSRKKRAASQKKAAPKATEEEDIFGVRQLADLIEAELGREYTPRELRALLRKMAREKNARIDREIIAGNKARYEWSGPDDPEVQTVLAAVKGGEIEAAKKEALDKLKADQAKKKAAAAAAAADDDDEDEDEAPKPRRRKKAKPPVDDAFEDLDEDDD